MIWKTARPWGYVALDATSGVVLPKRGRVARRFFSEATPEPLFTFLRLAAETGMRAGELCDCESLTSILSDPWFTYARARGEDKFNRP